MLGENEDQIISEQGVLTSDEVKVINENERPSQTPGSSKPASDTCCGNVVSWLHSIYCKIYISRVLSAWGDRMWGFATGLFFIHISPHSLQLTAIYGFATRGSILLFGAVIGDWVDKTPRLKASCTSLVIQNLAVSACAVIILLLLYLSQEILSISGLYVAGQVLVITLAALAALASLSSQLCLEKDWIVVIAGENKQQLAVMNASMRRIDLMTAILAPIAVGQIMTFAGVEIGCICVASWNILSLFAEYYFLWRIYNEVPQLENKSTANTDFDETQQETVQRKSVARLIFSKFLIIINGWQTYRFQPVVAAGLALAFLYMTVLGFDSITNAYAFSQGLTEAIISICFAVGSIFGISATFAFPWFYRRIGLERSGLIALFLEVSCLSLCVASIWLPGSPFDLYYIKPDPTNTSAFNLTSSNSTEVSALNTSQFTSIAVFLTGIVISRFGLWLADLSISQIYQEKVLESERGVVNGVQNSLNMLMDTLKFAMVIAAPNPQTFGILIIVSFLFICCGYISFAYYSYKIRGHLFHFEKLFKSSNKTKKKPVNFTLSGTEVLQTHM